MVLATGKVALDLMGQRTKEDVRDVAVVRVEQLHPWPADQIADALARYERAEEYIDAFGNHCGRVTVPAGMQSVLVPPPRR